jgi:hypothetical protein
MSDYPQFHCIKVTITKMNGDVIDQFQVRDWRNPYGDDNDENVGSQASEILLAERIRRDFQSDFSS